jgi:hypothetical protein
MDSSIAIDAIGADGLGKTGELVSGDDGGNINSGKAGKWPGLCSDGLLSSSPFVETGIPSDVLVCALSSFCQRTPNATVAKLTANSTTAAQINDFGKQPRLGRCNEAYLIAASSSTYPSAFLPDVSPASADGY